MESQRQSETEIYRDREIETEREIDTEIETERLRGRTELETDRETKKYRHGGLGLE